MTALKDDFDPQAHIRAMAPTLGLTLDGERAEGVSTFLSIAKGMAKILDAAPVPENTLELASVFDAGQATEKKK